MNRTAQSEFARPPGNSAERLAEYVRWLASGLALASFPLALWAVLSPGSLPGKAGWPEAVLVLTITLTTLTNLTRQLPAQNVIMAAAIVAFIGGAVHGVGATTGIPFGPFNYTDNAGPKIFGVLAWPVPALWIIAVLNSRGVARLILRPWRKLRTYGFWLMGLTAALVLLFAIALDPFASQARHYWLWLPTKFPFAWHSAPLVNFLGWLVTSLLILAFATPALINKMARPRKSPPDFQPLVVWLLALGLFAAGAAMQQLWSAVGFCVVAGFVAALFAIRGARW